MNNFLEKLPSRYKNRSGSDVRYLKNIDDSFYEWAKWASECDSCDPHERGIAQSAITAISAMSAYSFLRRDCEFFYMPLYGGGPDRSVTRAIGQCLQNIEDYAFRTRDLAFRLASQRYMKDWQERRDALLPPKLTAERLLPVRNIQKYIIEDTGKAATFYKSNGEWVQIHGVLCAEGIYENSRLTIFWIDMAANHDNNVALAGLIESEADGVVIEVRDLSGSPVFRVAGKVGTTPSPDYRSDKFRFGVYGTVEIDNLNMDVMKSVSGEVEKAYAAVADSGVAS